MTNGKNSLSDETEKCVKIMLQIVKKRGIIKAGAISGALNPYSKRQKNTLLGIMNL